MPQLKVQNQYRTTLTSSLSATGDLAFTVASPPTYTNGFIVISPDISTQREVVYFHDVIGSTVYVRSENRISPKAHASTESIQMNDVAEIFNTYSDMISQAFYCEKIGGLTIKVWGGYVLYNGTQVAVADTNLTLTDNATNYVKYTFNTNTISSDVADTGNVKAVITTLAGVITNIAYRFSKESLIDFTVALTGALPDQTGNAGKALVTNGTNVSWGSTLPSQTGNNGKFLTTDGTNPSWAIQGSTGEIKIWPLAAAPTDWLSCDGSAVSRATYANLFALIGTTYGVGDGSTTFNLPNLKNRTPIGVDTTVKITVDNCDAAWTAGTNVTATLDAADKKEGTNSVKLAVAAGATAAQILGYRAISSMSFAGKTTIGLWLKSDIAIAANDLQLRLDDTAALASPLESLNIPALVANQWTKVYLTLATPHLDTAIISVGIYQVVDKGAFNLWIDDIATGENYEIGSTGGEKTHTLATAELPSHNHSVPAGQGNTIMGAGSSTGVSTDGTPLISGSTGGGLTHNNLQPYLAIQFIIKT